MAFGALVGPGSDALVLLYRAVFITIRMINSSFCSISVRVQLGIFSPNLTLSFLQSFLLDGSDSRTRQTDRGHTGILLRTQSWRWHYVTTSTCKGAGAASHMRCRCLKIFLSPKQTISSMFFWIFFWEHWRNYAHRMWCDKQQPNFAWKLS